MRANEWIDPQLLRAFEAEGTTAHRLCTIDGGWAERFGEDVLISFRVETARDRLLQEFHRWAESAEFSVKRVFGRFLPKRNEERETPTLLAGNEADSLRTIVTENHLKFEIDFTAGYSVGLFVDQRENRTFIRQMKPRSLLNCFAYTCSFSVAAASVGAETMNVDLSKKSLERGRRNFTLNSISIEKHQFIPDDVRPVLRRLTRRGEKFDVIILDPPTFSRAKGGAAFHVEKDLEELITTALELTEHNSRVLVSTNCESLNEGALEGMGRYSLRVARRSGALHRQATPSDFPPGTAAKTVWLTLH
jgi:23S rRNA (cytosine1962-C5)-methyltransferase